MNKLVLRKLLMRGAAALLAAGSLSAARANMQNAVDVGEAALITVAHAEGAQVYECAPNARGETTWQFREPIATLMSGGKTIGRHYLGPSWEFSDGSMVTAKVVGRAPSGSAADIPMLKLEVTSRRNGGLLAEGTTIQRYNTKGGALEGPCATPGEIATVPYSAEYAFWR